MRHEAGEAQEAPHLGFQLARLCGFNDCEEFLISCESISFTFAGKDINSKGHVYVTKRIGNSDQLVLIWEHKLPGNTTNVSRGLLHNSAAQIIGEMISVHYWGNRSDKHEPLEVYAIRLIDDMVAFFRLEMTAEEVKAVCDDGVIPDPKLQVCVGSCVACHVVCIPCLHHRSTTCHSMHWMLVRSTV